MVQGDLGVVGLFLLGIGNVRMCISHLVDTVKHFLLGVTDRRGSQCTKHMKQQLQSFVTRMPWPLGTNVLCMLHCTCVTDHSVFVEFEL